MNAPDFLAIIVCIALAIRVTVLQRRLRESGEANCSLYKTIRTLREQIERSDSLEWTERRLLMAVQREQIEFQRWSRSGIHGDIAPWKAAKLEMDTLCVALLTARGEMPTPAMMRAEFRMSLPPGERPPIREDDVTPAYGMVAR